MTAVPMVDDVPLEVVTFARHTTRSRVIPMPVAGLAGDVQQRLGRSSHEVELHGVLLGDEAADALATLQEKASSGEEVPFSADITTALEVEKMILVEAQFWQQAGRPGRYEYRLHLRESPPLPEPASLDPFGEMGGFDTDLLDELSELADQMQDAMDAINDALDVLDAMTALGDLNLDNPLTPMRQQADSLSQSSQGTEGVGASLSGLLHEGGS